MPKMNDNSSQGHKMLYSSIKTIVDALSCFGLTFEVTESYLRNQVKKWQEQCLINLKEEGNAMKFLKLRLALIPHLYYNSQGDDPDQSIMKERITNFREAIALIGGKPYKFVKTFLHGQENGRVRNSQERAILIETLRVCKDGFELPSKELVEQEVRSTFNTLTSAPMENLSYTRFWRGERFPMKELEKMMSVHGLNSIGEARDLSYNFSRENIIRRIDLVIKQIFKNKSLKISNAKRLTAPLPSQNANYIASRKDRGAFGHIASYLQDQSINHDDIDRSMIEQIKNLTKDKYIIGNLIQTPLIDSVDDLTSWYITEKAIQERDNKVELVGLSEPLKVRTISKENPWITTANKVAQRTCWRSLYEGTYGICDFIGRVINEKDLEKLECMGEGLETEYCSIDYSQATNLIYSWASEAVINSLILHAGFDESERAMLLLSLTKHEIFYKELMGPQLRGQLMGSITSFPVLCILNLVVCHWALELSHQKSLTLKDLSKYLRINGDDGLLIGPRNTYKFWKCTSAVIGFSPSLGKVLVTNSQSAERGKLAIQMNNTTYLIGDQTIIGKNNLTVQEIYKVNSGILQGRTNLGKTLDSGKISKIFDARSGISASAHELIRGLSKEFQIHALDLYIKKVILTGYKGINIPWYMPVEFGGLGLPRLNNQHCPSWKDINCLAHDLTRKEGKKTILNLNSIIKGNDPSLQSLILKELPMPQKKLMSNSELSASEKAHYKELEEARDLRITKLYPAAYWWALGKSLREKLDFEDLVIPKERVKKQILNKIKKIYTPSASNQSSYLRDKYLEENKKDDYLAKEAYILHLQNDFITIDESPLPKLRVVGPYKGINDIKWRDWEKIAKIRNDLRKQSQYLEDVSNELNEKILNESRSRKAFYSSEKLMLIEYKLQEIRSLLTKRLDPQSKDERVNEIKNVLYIIK